MESLFASEVQFFVRRTGKLFEDATKNLHWPIDRQEGARFTIHAPLKL